MPHSAFLLFHTHLSSLLRSYCVSLYDLNLWLPFFTYLISQFSLDYYYYYSCVIGLSVSVALTLCRLLVSDIFLTYFSFVFKVRLVECSLHFLSCHVLFSSSFPVLSRFTFSIPFVLLHCCHLFMFVRCVLFHLVSFTVLFYFTVPVHRRWFHYHFLPRFIVRCTSVFQNIFCCFAPFCVSPIRMYSCYLLNFKAMYPFVFSSTSLIAFDPVFSTHHNFFNGYTQIHFFHFSRLVLRDFFLLYPLPSYTTFCGIYCFNSLLSTFFTFQFPPLVWRPAFMRCVMSG